MPENFIANVFSDAIENAAQFSWGIVIVFSICGMLILANVLRRKIPFLRRALLPTAVIAGLVALVIKETVFLSTAAAGAPVADIYVSDGVTFGHLFHRVLTSLVFHALPIAFIALTLRDKKDYQKVLTKDEKREQRTVSLKAGSIMTSTYMLQAALGLVVTIAMFWFIPDLLPGSGVFLVIGFGQGVGQAAATGGIWDVNLTGGLPVWSNFAIAIAAFGFLASSIPGMIFVNRIAKKRGITRARNEYQKSGDLPPIKVEGPDEIPLAEGIDKFTLQVCMVLGVYLLTIGLIFMIDVLLRLTGVQFLIDFIPTFWGFTFMMAIVVAILTKLVLRKLVKTKIMNRKYPNTYMMNRIAGLAFDVSVISGLVLISVTALGWFWIPIIVMSILGAAGTAIWLRIATAKTYPDFKDEAFLAFYGTLTGTISCGTLLSREIDPQLNKPAAEQCVVGSAVAILLAFPIMFLLPIAPNDLNFTWILAVCVAYFTILALFIFNAHRKILRRFRPAKVQTNGAEGADAIVSENGTEETLVESVSEDISATEEIVQ